jgi:hypothetical protein
MGKYNEKNRHMFMKNSMEFHGKFHEIPLNSMEIFMDFSLEISMEFHKNYIIFPWKIP